MSNLKVERINSYDFQIIGDDVDVQVTSFDSSQLNRLPRFGVLAHGKFAAMSLNYFGNFLRKNVNISGNYYKRRRRNIAATRPPFQRGKSTWLLWLTEQMAADKMMTQ